MEQMKGQMKGLNRNTTDKFYTSKKCVDLCMEFISKYIEIKPTSLIIEPSAGNGSFIEPIKLLDTTSVFYDLEPEHPEIIQKDYLTINQKEYLSYYNKEDYETIHIIGNPPFGRQSSTAIKFIKKSCEFCDTLSFILPKSFKKDSLQKHFPLNFHLIYQVDLPANSFIVNGEEHDVPCVFQIWIKNETERTTSVKLLPLGFVFVTKENKPDISFRRVGVNAGVIDTIIENKSTQSHYFIKFTNSKTAAENIIALKFINYDFNNTVGPKSISKQELIKEFIKVL